jgi:glycerol-3-phosphate O-acyltransferase
VHARQLPSDERLRAIQADPRFPEKYKGILQGFFDNYRRALREAGKSEADHDHLLATVVDLLYEQLDQPYAFEPYHQQITEPFDRYAFGLEFLRPVVDKAGSTVSGHANLDRADAQVAAGENVVFLANHQSEGDPQAISLLLEDTHPELGRQMIFVAGERVITDALAVPFSMGRNLLCIYSKRYIENPPDQKAAKHLHNKRTMDRMSELFAEGGHCIYVAPSGGRDRANASGVVEVAPFDPQSVEMFYLMAQRAGTPTHFYPMALRTYDVIPPPDTIQVELGEERVFRYNGIHLAVGAELDMDALAGASEDKHERRETRARAIWDQVDRAHSAFPPARRPIGRDAKVPGSTTS